MFETDMSDFERLADRLNALGSRELHEFPEFHPYLHKRGIKHVEGDQYMLEGHDPDKDLTQSEISLLEKKLHEAAGEFMQDVLDGKLRLRKRGLTTRRYRSDMRVRNNRPSRY